MEDYKQKYEEALARAKYLKENTDSIVALDVSACFEKIFPELVKSKDELIREEILNCFVEMKKQGCFPSKHKEQYDSWISWLKKQDEHNDFAPKSAMEAIKEEKIDNVNKVEPKFKVGDWVVLEDSLSIYKIVEVCKSWYEVISNNDGIHYSISFDEEDDCRLWTIEDAKDGNVLCFNDDVFILKYYILFNKVVCHCCYNKYFMPNNAYLITKEDFSKIHPATTEQRNFLFQKMKNMGYEWDVKEKKLIKL